MSKKLTTKEFIEKAKVVHGDKYNYSKVDYVNNDTKICIVCPIHGEFWQRPKRHIVCDGCPICANKIRNINNKSNTVEWIEKAELAHGNKYCYSKVDYINAHTKVCIICPIHGEFWQTPNDHLNNKGCYKCNESKLEKNTKLFLTKNNIAFESQKRFEWLGSLSLDFYLPSINLAIECQGKQHFGLGGWSDTYDFEGQYERDRRKKELCQENGIDLFYFCNKNEFVVNEMYTESNTFFDLDSLYEYIIKKKESVI